MNEDDIPGGATFQAMVDVGQALFLAHLQEMQGVPVEGISIPELKKKVLEAAQAHVDACTIPVE